MSDLDDFFSHQRDRIDVAALQRAFVLFIGAGSVGSVMALEMARAGLGHAGFADGDRLELHNPARHALPLAYVGANKAEALADHLPRTVLGIDCGALPRHVDDSFSDVDIDRLLAPADLVVVATDDRSVQRRIAERANALDRPAVIPGLYPERGGEVFVQLGPENACFECWDLFREEGVEVRGATSINADALRVIQQAVYVSLAVLDPTFAEAREFAPPSGDTRPRQLFVLRPGAPVLRAPVTRRPDCPGCSVGPSPLNRDGAPATRATAADHLGRIPGRRGIAAGWAFALNADPKPPTSVRVDVSDRVVVEGEAVTLEWRATNATHVEVDTLGRRGAVGGATVVVPRSRAFRVTAVNPFGRRESVSPTVRAIPLPRVQQLEPPIPPAFEVPAIAPIEGPALLTPPAPPEHVVGLPMVPGLALGRRERKS